MANLLQAIKTVVDNPISDLLSYYRGKNRINNVGDALEVFVKDIFADTLDESDESRKIVRYSSVFSYLGNQNNPPDLILKQGDAVEVKKIESLNSAIHLNSSYPKSKLFSNSPMITKACRECEDWKVKDLIYVIGIIGDAKLKSLWLIYGDCYFANRDVYENLMYRNDPLEIATLNTFGKCHVVSPASVFNQYYGFANDNDFNLYCVMTAEKYFSFPLKDRECCEKLTSMENFMILNKQILSPNNPHDSILAKLIYFEV